jgi:hypothetical protein
LLYITWFPNNPDSRRESIALHNLVSQQPRFPWGIHCCNMTEYAFFNRVAVALILLIKLEQEWLLIGNLKPPEKLKILLFKSPFLMMIFLVFDIV